MSNPGKENAVPPSEAVKPTENKETIPAIPAAGVGAAIGRMRAGRGSENIPRPAAPPGAVTRDRKGGSLKPPPVVANQSQETSDKGKQNPSAPPGAVARGRAGAFSKSTANIKFQDGTQSTGDGSAAPPGAGTRPPASRPKNAALQSGRFAVNAYLWTTPDQNPDPTGSILSQSLQKTVLNAAPGKYAGDIAMSLMRVLTPGMSKFRGIHKFCTAEGVVIGDESISLDDYLALNSTEDAVGPAEEKGATNNDPTKAAAITDGKTKQVPATLNVLKLSLYFRAPLQTTGVGAASVIPPALNMTLRDQPGVAGTSGGSGVDAQGNPLPPHKPLTALKLESTIDTDRTLAPILASTVPNVTAGTLTEDQWSIVLRNCAVMYGWKVDVRSGTISRAPRPAFQLRSKAPSGAEATSFVVDAIDAADAEDRKAAADQDATWERSIFAQGEPDEHTIKEYLNRRKEDVTASEVGAQSLVPQSQTNTPTKGIPNFRVNDDSRIDITVCRDSFAVSLAKSDFSSQSTEASVAGGYGGITASASLGIVSSDGHETQSRSASSSQTLVARYMYPRCDIFLRPEDLEPSPEFVALLEKIKITKSIDALRQVQDQYGQLFCQELTLGARLLSTKIIQSTEKSDLDNKKEEFKVSVGGSVQSPYGGASVKHESTKTDAQTKETLTTNSTESNVFEAVGGDTILANNPAAWANTAARPELWRVINRDALYPMVDMISLMPGFSEVQSWFFHAVPALSKYIRLDKNLSTNVRFKVESPTNSLSIDNHGDTLFYMGFEKDGHVTPRLNGRKESNGMSFWDRLDLPLQETLVLFSPATYRAPTLLGFKDHMVGDGPYGSRYNAQFAATQWTIFSPFGDEIKGSTRYELKSGARVIIRSVPFQDPAARKLADGTYERTAPVHLTVFRNAEGVFLPALSDNDQYQYWNIEKIGSRAGGPIKGGDSIRLCWKFSDQTTGFRDYVQDVFGRRRNQCPPELESSTLYLKVPWPRFEVSQTPTAMVMSNNSSLVDSEEVIIARTGTHNYLLQNLILRIDTIEHGVLGDSNDFMLLGLTQEKDVKLEDLLADRQRKWNEEQARRMEEERRRRPPPEPLQVWDKIFQYDNIGGAVGSTIGGAIGGAVVGFVHGFASLFT